MIGIYKITSPTNKIYIGQSVNIEKRFKSYLSMNSGNSKQVRLHRTFLKYGVENHIFEVVEECTMELLNERERYYQDLYNVLEKGLNCRLTASNDRSGKLSEEIKQKISNSNKGKKMSEELKLNKSIKFKGESNVMYGKKHTINSKLKMSNSRNPNKEFLGVSFAKERNKYLSQIRVFGTNIKINLGRYDCHLKAHLVYLNALKKIHLFNGNVKEFKLLINEN